MALSGSSISPEDLGVVCSSGDVEKLYSLLSKLDDVEGAVNLTFDDGVTLLMQTIIGAGSEAYNLYARYAECCSLLAQQGAVLETADTSYGRTAAHWSIYYHRDDILAVLIEAGCDMTCPDFEGTSPFHLAIQERATTCLAVSLHLLSTEILQVPHPQFLLPLHHSVSIGDKEASKILVSAGADINQADEQSGRTPLHIATEITNRSLVDFLIGCGASLDVADGRGLTPLHIACTEMEEGEGSLETIIKRVGGGEVLDIRDRQGLTPLMHACLYGNLPSVRVLLKKNVDVMILDPGGKHSLHYAAESSSQTAHECVHILLKKHKKLLGIKDGEGRSALHTCAMSGTTQSLDILLSSDSCQVEDKDTSLRTPLHWAALNGNCGVLSSLLERGAEVDATDALDSTPLHYACQLFYHHNGEAYTEEMAMRNQLVEECVDLLLRGRASVLTRDKRGLLPLHYSVQSHYNLPVCALLLDYGADINAKTTHELMTCLHIAARGSYIHTCQFLLEASGGELGRMVDVQGQTALHAAVEGMALGDMVSEGGVLVCMECLIQAGIQPDQTDYEMRTPAHIAASYGLTECLKLLKTYGANLGMPSVDGATPLHEAAANGHPTVLEFLLMSEATPIDEGAGHSKVTALHYAVQGGHMESVQLLLDYGAKVNTVSLSQDGEMLSPLDLCQQELPIYNLLIQHGALPSEDRGTAEEQYKETVESAFQGEEVDEDHDEKTPSIQSVRLSIPSRQSFAEVPIFEEEQVDRPSSVLPIRPVTPAIHSPSTPEAKQQGSNMLKKVFQKMIKKRSQQQEQEHPDGVTLSSAVGFCAAQATMIAAAIIGTPIGDKAREVAERVALEAVEELKKAATKQEAELPELVWLNEETDTPQTPTPLSSPPPTTPSPSSKFEVDPIERRMRKAKAQLDMMKSPGLLALEELVKAQETHMKIKRKFQEDKMRETIQKRRKEFKAAEARDTAVAEKIRKRLAEKMNKADSESEVVKKEIEEQLCRANQDNLALTNTMSELGINPRPTVAQWLQRKQLQKKTAMQDSLINWDKNRKCRESAILVEQTLLFHRALKHAAWGAKKNITSQIMALKHCYKERLENADQFMPKGMIPLGDAKHGHTRGHSPHAKTDREVDGERLGAIPPRHYMKSEWNYATPNVKTMVLATPTGFKKVITDVLPRSNGCLATSPEEPQLWKVGENYAVKGRLSLGLSSPFLGSSSTYVRATGPKTVHAGRSLHFLSPKDYKSVKAAEKAHMKELSQQFDSSSAQKPTSSLRSSRRSTLVIGPLDFQQERFQKFPGNQNYSSKEFPNHSLMDSIGQKILSPWQPNYKGPNDVPLLNMTVVKSPHDQQTSITT